MSFLSFLTYARNIGDTDAKVISSVGRIVKPTHMLCRSSRIYVNIGANNSSINNKNNNSSNNSRIHEIWATPIRKIL